VHDDQLDNKSNLTSLTVSELPDASLGKRFVFQVYVYTDFAVDGVKSDSSVSMILAGLPSKPTDAPTRQALTDESKLALAIGGAVQNNGSVIISFNIEIDDGLGGSFVELQGMTVNSLLMSATKSVGITSGRYYRARYRAKNEVGFGPYSEVSYILAANMPQQPTTIEAIIIDDHITI